MIGVGPWTGFDWDEGNRGKSWVTHRVSDDECAEVFFNLPLVVGLDPAHSVQENRYYVLGQTNAGRQLFIVFTERGSHIRIISARDMTRKERRVYHEADETPA